MKKNHDNFKVGRIMIVDDEAELTTALREALAGQGYETTGFTTGADALKVLAEQDYDLLLTDLMMPEMDGIALLQAGLEIDPNLVCIIMTGQGTVQTAVEAMKRGAFDYVLKPFKLNKLLPLLSRAMEVRSLRMDNIQLKETVAIHELGKAIAFSTDLNAIMNKVADAVLQQCASDEVSIMLPTDDGKELYIAVARGGHSEYIGERVPMGRGIAGWVARNRETVIIKGKVDDPRFSPINPRNDIRASVSMPMMAGGNLVGVLNVNVTKSHRHITLGQVKALSILVSILSPILENTWLNIKIRQTEEKYRSIFENATEGIYQSTPEGQFTTVNTAMASMLGYDSPEELMSAVTDIGGQLYVNPEERTKLIQMIEDHGQVKSFETRFYRKDGRIIWASINMHAVRDKKGNLLNYDGIEEDITARKLAERRQALTGRILETLNRQNEIINLVCDILLLLKEHTGIEAIGIRLREGEDFPYFETNGFHPHFLEAENHLCARDNAGEIIRDSEGNPYLECMCGNILCGRTDPTFPFFTEGGSFWSNRITELPASTSEEDCQARMRSRCNSEGYESVALIPLRSGDEIIGLLQLNDSRRDSFTIEMIQFLEGIGATIGIAVARKRAVEELRVTRNYLDNLIDHANAPIITWDTAYRITRFNHAFERLTGYTSEEISGQELFILFPETSCDESLNKIKRTSIGECWESIDLPIRRKDGVIRIVLWNSANIYAQDGKTIIANVAQGQDITEREEAKEKLTEAYDIINKSSSVVFTWRNQKGWPVEFTSENVERLFGYTAEEFITGEVNYAGCIHPEDLKRVTKEVAEFSSKAETTEFIHTPYRIIAKDGSEKIVKDWTYIVRDNDGRITHHKGIIEDITERKQAEEALRSKQMMLARTEGIAHIGSWAWNIATDKVTWSDELFRIFQRDPREGAPSFAEHPAFYHPEDMARLRQAVEAAVTDGTSYELELRAIRKDGETRVCVARGIPEMELGGRTVSLFGSLQDITDRKQAVEALRESEERFKCLFQEAPVGYFEYDSQGRITRVNQTELDMLFYPSEEMIGQPVWKFVIEEETARQQIMAKLAGTMPPFHSFERTYRRKDGTTFPVLIQDRLMKDEQGNITGIRCSLQDVTERKQAENSLKDTLERLRKAVNTTIQVMVSTVEARDPYTAGHQLRVADLASAIATDMGLSQEKIEGIRIAGSIHDIGKLSVPAEILSKPVKLSEIEFSLIKEHARTGYEILKDVESPWPLAEIVYQHHERMDGSGYPRNLKGEEILMEARIMAVADVVEAMASHRPYRPSLGIDAALEEIEKNRGIIYDKAVADACLRLFRDKGYGLPER